MTRDDITETRTDLASLTAAFREVSAAGRATFASVATDARATRTALVQTTDAGKALSSALRSGLNTAFRSALQDGARLSDILRSLALDVGRSVASNAIGGLANQIGGAIGQGLGTVLPFAKGGAVDSGRIRAFASGGIVTGPTLFPMRSGTGLMGEAGPEAIMPLRRGPDGRLGVAGGPSAVSTVTVNITTPDADSFQRSRTQIAATLARAVDRGRRNL